MPFGTRGGISVQHDFPADGEYVLTIGDMASGRSAAHGVREHRGRAARRQGVLPHHDRRRRRPEGHRPDAGNAVDEINGRLRDIRFQAPAGPAPHRRHLPAAQLRRERGAHSAPIRREGGQERQCLPSRAAGRGPLQDHGHRAIRQPRRRSSAAGPRSRAEEAACARQIIGTLAQRAFRRPVTDEDMLQPLMALLRDAATAGGFEAGMRERSRPSSPARISCTAPKRGDAAGALHAHRPGAGLAPVVLPLEQPAGRRTAARSRARRARRSPRCSKARCSRMLADPRGISLTHATSPSSG